MTEAAREELQIFIEKITPDEITYCAGGCGTELGYKIEGKSYSVATVIRIEEWLFCKACSEAEVV